MLNIIKSKLKNKNLNLNKNSEKEIFKSKESESNLRHWKNSIYTFNKNNYIFAPLFSKISINLIRGYFNLTLSNYNKLKKQFFFKKLNKSSNKIFLSEGQFKHTNDNVNITLFMYNRELQNYLYFKKFLNSKKQLLKINKLFNLIKLTGLKYHKNYLNIQKYILLNLYNNKNLSNFYLNNLKEIKKYNNLYYNNYIKLSLKIFVLQMYLLQLMFLNQAKFKNNFQKGLIDLLQKIYNKNVILNIINLKYFYLNSDILLQVLDLKLQNKRQKYKKYMKTILKKAKIDKKFFKLGSKYKFKFTLNDLDLLNNKDISNTYLNNLAFLKKNNQENIQKIVLNNIKLKKISGIRLKSKGRLTRRHTASRSLSDIKIKGSLTNINSLYGYSSPMLLGYQKSNINYTKLNSKTKAGSFGLKGWISASN